MASASALNVALSPTANDVDVANDLCEQFENVMDFFLFFLQVAYRKNGGDDVGRTLHHRTGLVHDTSTKSRRPDRPFHNMKLHECQHEG